MPRCVGATITLLPLAMLTINIGRQFFAQPTATVSARRLVVLHQRRPGAIAAVPQADSLAAPPPPPAALSSAPSPPCRPPSSDSSCNATAHVELWGGLVFPGTDNLQPTAEACCRSCREYTPNFDTMGGAQCNTFVYNPRTQACWLKHQPADALARAAKELAAHDPARANKRVEWSSGVWLERKPCADCTPPARFRGCISKEVCNTTRACGSPAVGAYAKVDPKCMAASPTSVRYRQLLAAGTPLVGFSEQAADYDGLGVRWGIGHKKQTWQECEQACRDFSARGGGGPFVGLPCNVWTWCSRKVCWEPDAHSHSFGDCWLKFQEEPEAPEVNMRTPHMRPAFMQRHRTAMAGGCPWVSGALLPPGVPFTNGTWGPVAEPHTHTHSVPLPVHSVHSVHRSKGTPCVQCTAPSALRAQCTDPSALSADTRTALTLCCAFVCDRPRAFW